MEKSQEKRSDTKKIIGKLGSVVAVAAMGFVIARIWKYRQQITDAWSIRVAFTMLASVIVCSLLVIIMAYCFLFLVRAVTGRKIQASLVVPLYVKSNLYKYLPGNIMHYVGRNQIAVESEATHPEIILCTLAEMGISCIGGLLAGTIFSFSYVREWLIEKGIIKQAGIIIICILAASGIILVFITLKKPAIKEKLNTIFKYKNIVLLLLLIIYNIFNQLLQGIMFLELLKAVGVVIPSGYALSIAGIYAFAWLVGFVTPGAPGGIGVREAMLSVFLTGMVDPGLIATAAVLNRIITTCGDVMAFMITAAAVKLHKRTKGDQGTGSKASELSASDNDQK